MPTFKVMLVRSVYGSVMVEADSLHEAENHVYARLQEESHPSEMDDDYEPGDWEMLDADLVNEGEDNE